MSSMAQPRSMCNPMEILLISEECGQYWNILDLLASGSGLTGLINSAFGAVILLAWINVYYHYWISFILTWGLMILVILDTLWGCNELGAVGLRPHPTSFCPSSSCLSSDLAPSLQSGSHWLQQQSDWACSGPASSSPSGFSFNYREALHVPPWPGWI